MHEPDLAGGPPASISIPSRPLCVLALLLGLLSGCQGPDPAPTTTAIVIPRANPAAEPVAAEAPEAGGPPAGEKLEEAQRLAKAQDYGRALAILDELRELPAGITVARAAEALRVEVKQHLLQSLYVDAVILLDHERLALGDPLTGEVVLINLAPEPLFIPASAPSSTGAEESFTTIHFELAHREFGLDGTVYDERTTWNLVVGEDIRLDPGARRSWPLSLDTLQFSPGRPTYRRWALAAMLYPARIQIGEEPYPGNLRFRPRTCEIFPRNYEHLADRPLDRLAEAIGKDSPVHVPLAAALATLEQRPEAIALLLETLARPGGEPPSRPTRTSCCVALRILTGEELPADPKEWLAWGRDRPLAGGSR